ncbi:MAG: ACP S-malonyltransferase [Gammaproteobacteria bacterium]
MIRIAVLFPGQGSQYTGMGKALYESDPEVRALFEEASDAIGMDMRALCFQGPDDKLKLTEFAQPAVSLVDAACLSVLKRGGVVPGAVAGHSLGEYPALYAAGALTFGTMMQLVRKRALYMQEAADLNPGGMAAVMGIDAERVTGICEEAQAAGYVVPANYNTPLQTIITGEVQGVEKALELFKKAGVRLLIPLKVSGAWHSKLMAAAGERMRVALADAEIRTPAIPIVANVTAGYVSAPRDIREVLVRQVSAPVLWDASVRRLAMDGCNRFIEAGPGKVLKGLMRDIDKNVTAYNVEDPDSLAKCLSALRAPSA